MQSTYDHDCKPEARAPRPVVIVVIIIIIIIIIIMNIVIIIIIFPLTIVVIIIAFMLIRPDEQGGHTGVFEKHSSGEESTLGK